MKIYIGADHAGFRLKDKLKIYLQKLKHNVVDLGNSVYNKNDDYPLFSGKVARAVAKNNNYSGILICGSGQGVCIAANKIRNVRAILAENTTDARLARNDDDANVLCLQGRYITDGKAKSIVKTFLGTKFGKAKRYKRRLDEIKALER